MNTAGDTANGDSYWTSTESETDPSMVYYIRFGKFLNEPISKTSTSRYTRCVKVYGDYEYGPEPELPDSEEPEQGGDEPGQGGDNPGGDNPGGDVGGNGGDLTVGGVWFEDSKAVGVVFWVAEDSKAAKVVSLERTSTTVAWSTVGQTFLGADSKTDGASNTAILKSSAEASSMPILEFCAGYGGDWYWPACNELAAIFNVKTAVDAALSVNGGTAMGTNQYWSSTEFNAENPLLAIHVKMDNGYIGGVADGVKKTGSTKRYGRCVKVVTR